MRSKINRRVFLKSSVAAGMITSTIGLGLLTPRSVIAEWNKDGFTADNVNAALEGILGSSDTTASDAIELKAPEVAENGAVVPVTLKTGLTDVDSVLIFAENNATPLCCVYKPGKRARPNVAIRIKMGKSGKAIGVVKSAGKLYTASREIKVTAGGC
ncbi:MAG: thiosulfate oxidation carrier protein SoxY [Gammaproteobacteria bacterium]|nr:thiosulfate oxidation carrier protein SoxY [Gammaproteobacteria bacterium]